MRSITSRLHIFWIIYESGQMRTVSSALLNQLSIEKVKKIDKWLHEINILPRMIVTFWDPIRAGLAGPKMEE